MPVTTAALMTVKVIILMMATRTTAAAVIKVTIIAMMLTAVMSATMTMKQEMDPGDLHLHILQSKVEYNYTKVVEGNGKSVERKEEQEEEHKESKARSRWKDREDSPSGFTLVDGISMSTLRDPEIGATNEQSFNEDIFDVHDNLLLIPSPALVERVKPEPCARCCPCFCFPCFPCFHRVWKWLVTIFNVSKKAQVANGHSDSRARQ
ncbi:uncharacterized protein LOC116423046 isoform X2 [Sarcophilus harrisii]|uniref:uncharacterized protein LOC116423046 isoform X2 n=1 Tax=Sarcophilus harrisii TaxID=9305 RepID=UPI001301CCF9|nr:uncharacterized protein LOC116423046 isoform X2 [Sarcophilus harrisii]